WPRPPPPPRSCPPRRGRRWRGAPPPLRGGSSPAISAASPRWLHAASMAGQDPPYGAVAMKLVIASGNRGKLAEFAGLLGDSGIDWIAQGELGVDDGEEAGLTFVENALLKARHAARETGLPALGDDSGLCVDALGGAPGLYSQRYAGADGDAAANIAKLLDALRGLPDERRGARFHAVIVLLRHAQDPQPLIAEGSWHGRIAHAPR